MTFNLYDIIGRVESNAYPYALRFEPAVYTRMSLGQVNAREKELIGIVQHANFCSEPTAWMILSSSWGEFQMMGITLYDLGYVGPIAVFMGNNDEQLEYCDKFLKRIGFGTMDWTDDPKWLLSDDGSPSEAIMFASRYNGPGNPQAYLLRLRQAYSELEGL